MHVWQLQEAKARLTELIKEAQNEPQIISRHGINEVVVINIKEYNQMFEKEDVVSFFRHSPLCGIDLALERDKSSMRDVNLDDKE
jgi:prevent-host-death family protein